MPKYSYKLVDAKNHLHSGTVNAATKGGAKKKLSVDGATVLFLKRDSAFDKQLSLPVFGFSAAERILFFQNLGNMMQVGVPMVRALSVVQKQISHKGVKKATGEMISDVENGQSLSSALRKHPKYFQPFIVETIAVGESTGELSDILARISNNLQQSNELRRKVVGAMAYPIIVIAVMILVMIGLTSYVLPKIADLYRELDAQLPLTTRVLLAVTGVFTNHPLYTLIAALLLAIAAIYTWKQPKGKRFFQRIFLKIPVFGDLIKDYNMARFFHSLETLVYSGVALLQSVEIARKTLKNEIYKDTLATMIPLLTHGVPFSETVKPYPQLFPLQVQSIIEVGESTGRMGETFKHITLTYERSINYKTQIMTSLIEPFLIVGIGIIIGGLALSVFLPIYQVSTVI